MSQLVAEYLSAGANRHPSAADWDTSGLLAFGADHNIALWQPQNEWSQGLDSLLSGHTDTVNAVKFIPESSGILVSGSVDKSLRIWGKDPASEQYKCTQTISDHQSSINCIAVSAHSSRIFVSGSADATVKIWALDEQNAAGLQQSISIVPRFFPLALALSPLAGSPDSHILAVAGTKDIIQIYVRDVEQSPDFSLQATLSGHEGWIRSLEFTQESFKSDSDLILASASQDKYIRLWRIHQGKDLPAVAASADPSFGAFMPGKSLSNKAHRFKAGGLDFLTTFEALLFGHEDWIYSTKWRAIGNKLQLLSASADNSLAIWEPDSSTGVWVTIARMGEISAEKGSTTATGSTGGFWCGLWSPSGETVVCLGRTGSWRLWNHQLDGDRWVQSVGISGHTQPITGIAWSKDGEYILSTSSDQTSRLHAKWKCNDITSWHEMSRPQIHGYDLNCIDTLGTSQFVSGADEKLLRVFREPRAVASLLTKLCGFSDSYIEDMPDAANMPVLGLSNKAIDAIDDDQETYHENGESNGREQVDPASIIHKSTLDLSHPPLEEHLSRHTLWPETEKLYGHGYEISSLAASHDGSLIATACKASSIDHAVIRIFETKTWHEVKPPLTAHSLTIARLRFSNDDKYLLSVGRDRQWAVFSRDEKDRDRYEWAALHPKGHTRMILDAAWAPTQRRVFATAGRDKETKIWGLVSGDGPLTFELLGKIAEGHPVTAIDFSTRIMGNGKFYLAVGTEVGLVKVYELSLDEDGQAREQEVKFLRPFAAHTKAITQLAWKPSVDEGEKSLRLAVASEDNSLRIYYISEFSS